MAELTQNEKLLLVSNFLVDGQPKARQHEVFTALEGMNQNALAAFLRDTQRVAGLPVDAANMSKLAQGIIAYNGSDERQKRDDILRLEELQARLENELAATRASLEAANTQVASQTARADTAEADNARLREENAEAKLEIQTVSGERDAGLRRAERAEEIGRSLTAQLVQAGDENNALETARNAETVRAEDALARLGLRDEQAYAEHEQSRGAALAGLPSNDPIPVGMSSGPKQRFAMGETGAGLSTGPQQRFAMGTPDIGASGPKQRFANGAPFEGAPSGPQQRFANGTTDATPAVSNTIDLDAINAQVEALGLPYESRKQVARLQAALNATRQLGQPLDVDGRMGRNTQAAMLVFDSEKLSGLSEEDRAALKDMVATVGGIAFTKQANKDVPKLAETLVAAIDKSQMGPTATQVAQDAPAQGVDTTEVAAPVLPKANPARTQHDVAQR